MYGWVESIVVWIEHKVRQMIETFVDTILWNKQNVLQIVLKLKFDLNLNNENNN